MTLKLIPLITIFSLASCKCPPPIDGVKQPCQYVGPSVSGSIGFQGITVGLKLWSADDHTGTITIPPVILGEPVNVK